MSKYIVKPGYEDVFVWFLQEENIRYRLEINEEFFVYIPQMNDIQRKTIENINYITLCKCITQ